MIKNILSQKNDLLNMLYFVYAEIGLKFLNLSTVVCCLHLSGPTFSKWVFKLFCVKRQ